MNKLELISAILGIGEMSNTTPNSDSENEFMEIGKVYAFRTVTMIYTGRIKAISSAEVLLEEAAWIPDSGRWADFVDTGAHNEAEPYKRPVILSRGAFLDVTEIPSVIRKQK
ncbi:MAG: hypothetical protein ACRCST_00710 [Turicibacter sp.]